MFETVTAIAPARLHLGFLDMNGGLGRRFGSLGLAIDHPVTRLSIARDATTSVEGPEAERASAHLALLTQHLGLASNYKLIIHEAIPAHAGFGSGTQLALAVAAALKRLEGLAPNASDDAFLLRRGGRSGIGVGLFERGGLIVDGGRGERTLTPPVIARLDFPQEWRVILVFDPRIEGIHGPQESASFAKLAPFEATAAAEICRLVLIKALPAVVERDIDMFGEAIARIQQIVGAYFAPAQGGAPYTSAVVGQIMAELQMHGAKGPGQSSWGPTGFAFAASAEEAQRLYSLVQAKAAALGVDLRICQGINHAAIVKGEPLMANK
ncbi:MAG: beta-ribofuranosylaminobenzene 5'-phosphate synthase family protein [Methylocella sp.]